MGLAIDGLGGVRHFPAVRGSIVFSATLRTPRTSLDSTGRCTERLYLCRAAIRVDVAGLVPHVKRIVIVHHKYPVCRDFKDPCTILQLQVLPLAAVLDDRELPSIARREDDPDWLPDRLA